MFVVLQGDIQSPSAVLVPDFDRGHDHKHRDGPVPGTFVVEFDIGAHIAPPYLLPLGQNMSVGGSEDGVLSLA